ncbi:MAG TPA: hypothetical protein VFE24_15930, partial [Pirellulales bacterium]|nr:hypothetical protein [Pirellulales bacterium]
MTRFAQSLQRLHLPSWPELKERTKLWFEQNASTWAISTIVHVVLLLVAMIVLSRVLAAPKHEEPRIDSVATTDDAPLPIFAAINKPPLQPSILDDAAVRAIEDNPVAQIEQHNDDSPDFEARGGGTATGIATGGGLGFDIKAAGLGPVLKGGGGIESGLGAGTHGGKGGAGEGFGLRGAGDHGGIPGVTAPSERAVALALNWLARHQNDDGSWSMDHSHATKCRDKTCTGPAITTSAAGATALGVLPFLAAGQTQDKGFYKTQIGKAIVFLVKHQASNGDLAPGEQ